jgi:two-component system NarL family response regulator
MPVQGETSVSEVEEIRILVADTHSLFRESVRAVIESEPDMVVVAEARDGTQLVVEAEANRPHIAIVDAALPNGEGIRAVNALRERVPACRILVLAELEDQALLAEVVEAGASGYLTKDCPLKDLIDATRAIHRGEIVIPRWMLGALLGRLVMRRKERDEALRRMARLTRREREVLALLADGADNESIARTLVISPETARTHVQNLLNKLDVHSRLEAAAFVMQNGILDDLGIRNREPFAL